MVIFNTKTRWVIIFITIQLILIITHITNKNIWIKTSYITQKYENELTQLKEQKKNLINELYELKNPKKIKLYAEKKMGMTPIKRSDLKRIPLYEYHS